MNTEKIFNNPPLVVGVQIISYYIQFINNNFFFNSEHCTVEYNGDAVVLYPKAALCSVDGIPISEPTRLPQGT